jgi:hypothetical protein
VILDAEIVLMHVQSFVLFEFWVLRSRHIGCDYQ